MLKKSNSKIWECDFDLKEIKGTFAELEHLRQKMDQIMKNLSQPPMRDDDIGDSSPPDNLTEDGDRYTQPSVKTYN